jgi:type 2 lantibiotic biosynthesis protein LanM
MELDSYHPDLLRDALDRDRHFDRLWLGVGNENLSTFVLRQEREELERLDVPLFSSRPGERRLYCGTGRHLDDFFEASGLEIVAARVGRLGERNLELQRWMVGASLTALDASGRHRSEPVPVSPRRELEPPGPERLLTAAKQIRCRLRELALLGVDGDLSWVGIFWTDEDNVAPMPLGCDLYAGLPGIAFFLEYLAATDRDEASREMAEATWRSVGRGLAEGREIFDQPGAFAGLGGVLYLALHLSRLWNRPDLLSEAAVWAGWLEEWLPEDRSLDVLAGSAGCIPVLLALERATGESRYLDLAERCGDRVLSAARQRPEGIGWINPLAGDRPLSGFSHGGAGFAWALAQLARATGDERFGRASRAALVYERTLFDPGEGNWRDLRPFRGPEGGFNVAWCHGAVGIGLARLAILELDLEEDEARRAEIGRELDVALETTVKYGAGGDHTLCHGALGNAEFLARAGRFLDRPDAVRRAGQIAAVVCDEVEAGRFHCGIPGGYETPGLMDGLAGIGFGLLRLAAPETVPSVLLLEPPVGVGPVTTPRRQETAVAS